MAKNKKWLIVLLYAVMFQVGLQVASLVKKHIYYPLQSNLAEDFGFHQGIPLYLIFMGVLAGCFIVFMIWLGRKLYSQFRYGVWIPFGITLINVLIGIPIATGNWFIQSKSFTISFAYYWNPNVTLEFYLAMNILLVFAAVEVWRNRKKSE